LVSALLLAALAGSVGGGAWFYEWYKHLPAPRTVAVFANDIPVTGLEKVLHPSAIRVRFSDSAAPLDLIGKRVTAGITIEPAVDGYWTWENDQLLAFYPAQDWPADTKFHITLDRKVVARHVLLRRYGLDFTTPEFRGEIKKLEFYQDPKDPTMKKVVCTLEFTHSVAPGEIERYLSLSMVGDSQVFPKGAPQFSVDLGLHNRLAYIHTARLDLPQREDFMKLVLSKGLQTSQGGAALKADLCNTVRIPTKFCFFKVDNTKGTIVRNAAGEPEQCIILTTSAEAAPEEVAKGLEIYLLPHNKEADTDGDSDEATQTKADSDDDGQEDAPGDSEPEWDSPSEVDQDVLAAATPVSFTLVPSRTETSKVHSFKIHVVKTGSLYVRLRKGTKAAGDFELSEDYDAVTPVPAPPVEISIEGKGGVLALSGERKVSIVSRGVEQIEYTISRVPADQINHLVSQTQGEFQNPEFLNDSFDENNIARIVREKQTIASPDRFKPSYSTFDFTSHLGPATDGGSALQGLFFLEARAWDPKTKKYIRDVRERRFILVTDLGILVKENADDSRDVFVQALASRTPMAGATVEVLSLNGVPAESGTTGAEGRVAFGAIGKVTKEKEPTAIVVRNGQDVAFIPYHRDDREVDFSRFDIGGENVPSGTDLDAFVFTERGVYRPGDEMHIGFAVKQVNWNGNLTGLPLETEVLDARNTKAQIKRVNLPAGGFGEFTYRTAYESPTGDYAINVYLVRDGKRGDLLGSTSVVVKEFLPDRMKIEAHLSKEQPKGWITPEEVSARVTLRNLYGTPATNRRITGKINLCPSGFCFDNYPGYTFFDQLRDHKSDIKDQSDDLGEETSDDGGSVSFDLNLERFANATYQMTFETEGFEADGGRSVSATVSTLVSALPYVIGNKSDGALDYVKMNRGQSIEFIAIDQGLNRIAMQNLKLSLTRQDYVSVLTKQEDGTYAYESVEKDEIVSAQPVTIPAEGWKWKLPVGSPGTYRAELRNADGNRVSAVWFTVVGEGEMRRALDRNAELKVKLDRKSYNSGDEIEVNIVAPYTGSGLITIERDKVYASQWFTTDKNSTVQRIRVPDGLDGTGYVNVSFIRALDSREIYMSPLSYGVVPFEANRDRRRIDVSLETQKVSKPGEPLKIKYKANRPSKIVIFAVDEGILQVTGYTTPDPLEYFFRKQALSVATSQIVDLILPEFSILRAAATGGDGEARQLNPFRRVTDKPVVYWSGIVDVDTMQREVTYNVPDYFSGNLKVMAVAISGDAVGSAEAATLIRGPFVITPGVPTFVAPGDKFEIGVTVANSVIGSGTNAQVGISAKLSEHLEIVQAPAGLLPIPEGREATVTFVLRAKEKLGSASITFLASAEGQESRLRATLSVRPPVLLMTDVLGGNTNKSSVDLAVTRQLRPEYRELQAVLSTLPLGLAHGLDSYLHNYPAGCSEQLSSGALCRLLLADESDFGLKRLEVAEQLEHTFEILRHRQNNQGAFGYWGPDTAPKIDFLSVYVMHFLIEARAAGFDPPADMFQLGMRDLQRMVSETPNGLNDERTVAYAIYLLTREEVITTNYILNLRDYFERTEGEAWKNDITGVYLAGAYAMLKNDEQADELIRAYRLGRHDAGHWYDFYVPLGMDAQYIAVVARHFPQMLDKITPSDFHWITDPIEQGEFNTLSAAYAVLALKGYSHHLQMSPPELTISERVNDDWREVRGGGQLLMRVPFSGEATALRFAVNPAAGSLGAYYQAISTGFEVRMPTEEIRNGMEIYREYRNANGEVTDSVRMGERLTVVLRMRSLNGRVINNASIVDLLPGGFEVAKSSIEPGQHTCGCDYVDVREDRVILYRTVTPDASCVSYQIKATNRGEFTVPPIFAESMYDRGIKARGLGGTLRVTNPE